MSALYSISTGIIKVVASIRVTAKYLNGFTADTSIASICPDTFMEPNSAAICEPEFPAQMSAEIKGARAFIIDIPIRIAHQIKLHRILLI